MEPKILTPEEVKSERERLIPEYKEEWDNIYDEMIAYYERLSNFIEDYEVYDEDMIDLFKNVEKIIFG